MKILVTGEGGFIGKHVCQFFCDKGISVFGWNRRENNNSKWDSKQVDLLNEEAIYLELSRLKPDIIIHCAGAANVRKSVENPYEDYMGNVTITHNLLFALHRANLPTTRVVFLSSAAVYGNPKKLPITEDMELDPLSPYALHKTMCESVCKYMHQNYNLDIKIVRIFSAFGEGLRKQIFWDMYCKVKNTKHLEMYGTGEESRDYINIRDLVQAIYLIALKAPKEELIYNVANGEETKIKEVAQCFAEKAGISLDKISFSGVEKEGDPINWRADITKLKKLGYEKKVSLDIGIDWYLAWAENEKK